MFHQRHILPIAATLGTALLAACGGGGTSSTPPLAPASLGTTVAAATPVPTSAPAKATVPATPAPATPVPATPVPTAVPAAAPLATAQLAGAAGFINAQSHTVYVFDGDLAAPGTSTCNGSCAAVWPSVAASASVTYAAPFGTITRADGTAQLTYAGRPLYTFVVDTVAGSIAGNGITSFGNIWHIARPTSTGVAAAPTPAPGPVY